MNCPTLTVAGQASEVVASDGSVVLNVPITLRQRSGRRVVALGGPRCESGERTRTGATPVQLALARGHRWLRMIEAGEVSSLREIAQRDGADHSYVAKHLNLTLLAPDIVAAILEDALAGWRPAQCPTDQPAGVVGRSAGGARDDACAASGENREIGRNLKALYFQVDRSSEDASLQLHSDQ